MYLLNFQSYRDISSVIALGYFLNQRDKDCLLTWTNANLMPISVCGGGGGGGPGIFLWNT